MESGATNSEPSTGVPSPGVLASGPAPTQCPRCQQSLDGEYYGVCSSCAAALRSTYSGESRGDVSATEYEPKMNVTPNAIASKE